MKLHSARTYIFGGILLLGLQMPSCGTGIASSVDSDKLPPQPPTPLSGQEVCKIAKSITVIILSADGKSAGTGFLIERKQGSNKPIFLYKVVTNGHVLSAANSYKIQTPDGTIYQANPLFRLGGANSGNDLAILQFQSNKSDYQIAKLAHGFILSPDKKDRVVAAGFPIRTGIATSSEWVCTEPGEVSFVLQSQTMKGGYGIGYFLDIRKGMSGGPLLNLQGEVVGINGKHSRPILGGNKLYVYEDGNLVNDKPRDLLLRSSWAIPMETLVSIGRSNGITLAFNDRPNIRPDRNRALNPLPNLPSPNISPSPSSAVEQPKSTETSRNSDSSIIPKTSPEPSFNQALSKIAQQITVKVEIGNYLQRSGILIDRQVYQKRFMYKVLTLDSKDNPNAYRIYFKDKIITPLGNNQLIRLPDGNNLVVLTFVSPELYEVAAMENSSSLTKEQEVFAAGYISQKDFDIFQLRKGRVKVVQGEPGVVSVGVSNNLDKEMLGGPLLNSQGKVIAINVQSNYVGNNSSNPSASSPENSYSWAIPNSVLSVATP